MLISPAGEEEIRTFKYRGGSLSLSYKYLWSPLADYLLKFVPETWAPNSITLSGFFINALGSVVLTAHTPNDQPAAAWALLFYSVCCFVYQTLDNIDGKQARKLGNSTPLGMMLDHGCDALGLIFLTMAVARIICFTSSFGILWVFALGVSFSFYASAWSQNHAQGVMLLGVVNAVDDGIPVIWATSLFCSLCGQDIWLIPIQVWGTTYQLNDLIVTGILFSGLSKLALMQSRCGRL